MKPTTDHADILEMLRRHSDGEDICGHAANLIEWQAKELRHLARCIHDRDTKIKELEAMISKGQAMSDTNTNKEVEAVISRLRSHTNNIKAGIWIAEDCQEAADLLERLQRKVAKLEADIEAAYAEQGET